MIDATSERLCLEVGYSPYYDIALKAEPVNFLAQLAHHLAQDLYHLAYLSHFCSKIRHNAIQI